MRFVMNKKIDEMMIKFNKSGNVVGHKVFNSGHINNTVLVYVDEEGKCNKYVLQRINTNVFNRPEEVMENIANVTRYVGRQLENQGISSKGRVLNFSMADNGKYFAIDSTGGYWRLYDFIDNSVTFDTADNNVLFETGRAFGEFQTLLKDYPSHELYETIPDFHNTPKRYVKFKQVLLADPCNRVQYVHPEISQYLALESVVSRMQKMLDAGRLPLRVTHNDTKCNNVLFDDKTYKYLCVIDLDTVMPGLAGFDFGDAVRFATNTCAEDCRDLESIKVDLDKFRAFTQGFVNEVGGALTKEEIDTLVLGAITMTTECGLRFLTDFLDGDNYFKIEYPQQNLDRARCQLKLAKEMLQHKNEMEKIVQECVGQNSSSAKRSLEEDEIEL